MTKALSHLAIISATWLLVCLVPKVISSLLMFAFDSLITALVAFANVYTRKAFFLQRTRSKLQSHVSLIIKMFVYSVKTQSQMSVKQTSSWQATVQSNQQLYMTTHTVQDFLMNNSAVLHWKYHPCGPQTRPRRFVHVDWSYMCLCSSAGMGGSCLAVPPPPHL